ncbi:MAG: hypothetical protein P8Y18_10980 [Candidatus Bathyarchaeota archaeon]
MVKCIICKKTFKSQRGLSTHLTRTHNIRGSHDRLSLNTIQKFFPLLTKNRWAKAERKLKIKMENAGDDEWIQGYLHALNGMIIALKVLSNTLSKQNIFDAAYFQAWEDFTKYTLDLQD